MNYTKPCPNCGNETVYTVSSPGHPWWVQCPKCSFRGPESDSAEAADKAWNESQPANPIDYGTS